MSTPEASLIVLKIDAPTLDWPILLQLAPIMAGPPGPGIPTGGTTGQQLVKTSGADFATGWVDPSNPLLHALTGFAIGQNLPITANDTILTAFEKAQAQINAGGGGGGGIVGYPVVTPELFGAIGDGQSHPLSQRFGTLAEAQAVYPFATALTDEIDWCGWVAAVNNFYDTQLPSFAFTGLNLSGGEIWAGGQYIVNKTIPVTLFKCRVRGRMSPRSVETKLNGTASWIQYNGPDGTVDQPVWIFDAYTRTELGAAPPNRLPQTLGVAFDCTGLGFLGKFGNMRGAPSASGFVSGVRVRVGAFCNVSDCGFGGTLYDGITFTGTQLFATVNRNLFYGVHRDGIANWAFLGDFSTTIWIRENEFGYVGRYAYNLDMYGSVEAMPVVECNSFEHTFDSYYVENPHWFAQGIVSGMFLAGGGVAQFSDNRCEGITGQTPGYLADLHLLSGNAQRVANSTVSAVAITSSKASQPRSAAFNAFLTAHGYSDMTDTRYMPACTLNDFVGEADQVQFQQILNLGTIYVLDGRGLSQNIPHTFIGITAHLKSLPVAGDFVTTAVPPTEIAHPNLAVLGAFLSAKTSFNTAATRAQPAQYQQQFLMTDSFAARRGIDNIDEYAMFNEMWLRWANSGTTVNGYLGWYMNRGMGNNQFIDANGLDLPMFEANPRDENGAPVGRGHYEVGVVTSRKIRYEFASSPPAAGSWKSGDIAYNAAPVLNAPMGWVCVATGNPGTWIPFGYIRAEDPDALAWRARVIAATESGTVSDNDYEAVKQFIVSAKTNGYWNLLSRFNPFVGSTLPAVMVPVKASLGDPIDTPVAFAGGYVNFMRTRGLIFTNSGPYIRTGLVPSGNLANGNTHMGIYVLSGAPETSGMGAFLTGTGAAMSMYPIGPAGVISDAYDYPASRITAGPALGGPTFVMQNRSVGANEVIRDGNSIGAGGASAASIAGVTLELYVGAINVDGAPAAAMGGSGPVTVGCYSIGAAMSVTPAMQFSQDLKILMRALGRL